MAWTTPRTWATGDLISATYMNTHVRDNDQYLYDNTITRVGCALKRNAAQSCGTATTVTISWDAETSDPQGFIAVTGTTCTVPANYAGLYVASAHMIWASDPGSSTALWLEWTVGGTTYTTTTEEGSAARPGSGSTYYIGTTGFMPLSASDTLLVKVRQSSGSSINITGRLDLFRLNV